MNTRLVIATLLAVVLAALSSGCASSPEAHENMSRFLNGMAAGAVVGASMRPQPIYVQQQMQQTQTTCSRWGNRVECWSR